MKKGKVNIMPDYSNVLNHGVTSATPDKILLGAGTIHVGLEYTNGSWNFNDTIFGATKGGSKVTITPEIYDPEIDGVNVKTKGISDIKIGETAQMEVNFAELTGELIKKLTLGKTGTSADSNMNLIEGKPQIESGDYFEKFAFVGKTVTGKPIIVIFDYAICTNGLGTDALNKSNSAISATVECRADLSGGNLDVLPYHIYYPTETTTSSSSSSSSSGTEN